MISARASPSHQNKLYIDGWTQPSTTDSASRFLFFLDPRRRRRRLAPRFLRLKTGNYRDAGAFWHLPFATILLRYFLRGGTIFACHSVHWESHSGWIEQNPCLDMSKRIFRLPEQTVGWRTREKLRIICCMRQEFVRSIENAFACTRARTWIQLNVTLGVSLNYTAHLSSRCMNNATKLIMRQVSEGTTL